MHGRAAVPSRRRHGGPGSVPAKVSVVLDDEAKGVAPLLVHLLRRRPAAGGYPGVGFAHIVVLLLKFPESLEFVRFPDWSYLGHGSSFLAN